jgi:hypothetical protein
MITQISPIEQAQEFAARMKADPEVCSVKISERPDGTVCVKVEAMAAIGKKSVNKKHEFCSRLIGNWGMVLSSQTKAALEILDDCRSITKDQATAVIAEVSPQLPEGWFFGKRAFDGRLTITKKGKLTRVASQQIFA